MSHALLVSAKKSESPPVQLHELNARDGGLLGSEPEKLLEQDSLSDLDQQRFVVLLEGCCNSFCYRRIMRLSLMHKAKNVPAQIII